MRGVQFLRRDAGNHAAAKQAQGTCEALSQMHRIMHVQPSAHSSLQVASSTLIDTFNFQLSMQEARQKAVFQSCCSTFIWLSRNLDSTASFHRPVMSPCGDGPGECDR